MALIVDSGLPPTIVIFTVCSPGCRAKNWSSPGFIRSQIRPLSSLIDRFPGSVTIVIGDVTSPSTKSLDPSGPMISTSLPGPCISHTGHTGASPSTTSSCSPCTVESARKIGKNGKLYAPSISSPARRTLSDSTRACVFECTSDSVNRPTTKYTAPSVTVYSPEYEPAYDSENRVDCEPAITWSSASRARTSSEICPTSGPATNDTAASTVTTSPGTTLINRDEKNPPCR